MVQINIWFSPRSRSTALVRCLSNIPDSKVFFENFIWTYFLGDKSSLYTERHGDELGVLQNIPIFPGYNIDSIIKQWTEHPAKVKILKDFFFTTQGRHEEIIEDDSVNVFLVRDPEFVFTSFLPTANQFFYYTVSSVIFDVTVLYKSLLDGVEIVSQMCSKPPLIIDGSLLATKEGSTKVVKAICDRAGVEFKESLLTWKPTDGLDPNWTSPEGLAISDTEQGFFTKVNASTSFADSQERVVNLDELAKDHPKMVEDINACKPFYEKIINMPYVFKID